MSAGQISALADGALVEALRAGDEAAFEELFRRYYPTVHAVLLRLTGNRQDAEDLAQEVFVRLFQRPLVGGPEANVGGWLYRVATNLGFNAVRSRRRGRNRLLRWARLEWPLRRSAPNVASEAMMRDEAEQVRQALAELPERDRVALVLRASGVTYVEIASAIGVKASSVGTILARAERALQDRYAAFELEARKDVSSA